MLRISVNLLARLAKMNDSRPKVQASRRSGGDGVPEVFCSDEQGVISVPLDECRKLALAALMHEGVRGACELSVFFVDEATISELNSEHMGKIGPTDVLAFPLDTAEYNEAQGPGTPSRGPSRPAFDTDDVPTLLGDVVICPAIAMKQCEDHAGNFADEIALLLVHGILHVLGFDHDLEDEKTEMRAHEVAILMEHHWNGPVPSGFRQEQDE